MPRPNGGSVYPTMRRVGEVEESDGGLTVRDHAAIEFGKSLVSRDEINRAFAASALDKYVAALAGVTYLLADAMLAERAK